MNDILKQRLVGALILVALGVVFWPIIFVQPGDRPSAEQARIPPRPEVNTTPIEPPDQVGLRPSREVEARLEAGSFDPVEQDVGIGPGPAPAAETAAAAAEEPAPPEKTPTPAPPLSLHCQSHVVLRLFDPYFSSCLLCLTLCIVVWCSVSCAVTQVFAAVFRRFLIRQPSPGNSNIMLVSINSN